MRLTVLGATGSIGVSTLDVVAQHPDRFQINALTAHRNVELLRQQCLKFRPRLAVVGQAEDAHNLQTALSAEGVDTQVLWGPQALVDVAVDSATDAVMAAIVGAAGLPSAIAAAGAGKRVLLANKEALVMAGPVFLRAVRAGGATLLPIDSEHNAVFQCMPADFQTGVRRVVLTASGGPFRTWTPAEMADVTPEQAVAHPNWSMGRKISVDSATMMNKGLELIEAALLFGLPPEQLDVLIHPESVIHSMVEYLDGSTLAQLGHPDMRTPIAHALAYPERVDIGLPLLDLAQRGRLSFERPDEQRFPCLALARAAMVAGGSVPTVLNAANELAVEAFLSQQLSFGAISEVIEDVLAEVSLPTPGSLDDVLAVDQQARRVTRLRLDRH